MWVVPRCGVAWGLIYVSPHEPLPNALLYPQSNTDNPPHAPPAIQATTHVPFRRCVEKRGQGEGMGGRHEGQEGKRPHLVRRWIYYA